MLKDETEKNIKLKGMKKIPKSTELSCQTHDSSH
jgi:hypothetical protein